LSDLEVISRQYQDLVQGLGLLELLGGGEWRWFNRQMRSVAIASEDLWSARIVTAAEPRCHARFSSTGASGSWRIEIAGRAMVS
jgi:hypothetical protein